MLETFKPSAFTQRISDGDLIFRDVLDDFFSLIFHEWKISHWFPGISNLTLCRAFDMKTRRSRQISGFDTSSERSLRGEEKKPELHNLPSSDSFILGGRAAPGRQQAAEAAVAPGASSRGRKSGASRRGGWVVAYLVT